VLVRLAEVTGQPIPFDTYTVRTPSGGLHLYFRSPEAGGFRNTSGKLGWRIDTRAAGGYVVAAGSVRPEGAYTVTNAAPIAPLPAWLARALTPPAPPPPAPPITLPVGRISHYVRAVVADECRTVATAPVGRRHSSLLRAARILGEFVGGGVLELETARAALRQAAAGHIGIENCTAREVERTIHDGLAFGQKRPRRLRGRHA